MGHGKGSSWVDQNELQGSLHWHTRAKGNWWKKGNYAIARCSSHRQLAKVQRGKPKNPAHTSPRCIIPWLWWPYWGTFLQLPCTFSEASAEFDPGWQWPFYCPPGTETLHYILSRRYQRSGTSFDPLRLSWSTSDRCIKNEAAKRRLCRRLPLGNLDHFLCGRKPQCFPVVCLWVRLIWRSGKH